LSAKEKAVPGEAEPRSMDYFLLGQDGDPTLVEIKRVVTRGFVVKLWTRCTTTPLKPASCQWPMPD
jgi:hypothetical protein